MVVFSLVQVLYLPKHSMRADFSTTCSLSQNVVSESSQLCLQLESHSNQLVGYRCAIAWSWNACETLSMNFRICRRKVDSTLQCLDWADLVTLSVEMDLCRRALLLVSLIAYLVDGPAKRLSASHWAQWLLPALVSMAKATRAEFISKRFALSYHPKLSNLPCEVHTERPSQQG